MIFPDYDRSSLSLTSSAVRYFGGSCAYPTLREIDEKLKEGGISKIVIVLCDGMGEYLLKRHLPETSFLRTHDRAAVSAVYPSTTTAATTSIWTGLSPLEHGWLGWSLYFKSCARQLDVFSGMESHLGDRFPGGSPAPKLMPLPPALGSPEGAKTHMIFPFVSYATNGCCQTHTIREFGDMLTCALSLCREEGPKLICMYTGEPDHTMHLAGVNAPETKAHFERIDRELSLFASRLPDDALLIATADHGLVDAVEPVIVNEIRSLDECLWMPPCVEPRASAMFVKPWRRAQFEREFQAVCGEDFLLISREDALKNHLLGRGTPHPRTEDFMGDYLACATGSRFIRYDTMEGKVPSLIGQHAGLTEEEMTVPVILARGGEKSA